MSKDSILELQHYSHVFVVFVFHLNSNGKVVENTFGNKDESNKDEGESGTDDKKKKSKSTTIQRQFPSKIAPPSLGGKKVGVFSTRTPHRPNPIGFSLCRLDKVIVHKKKKKHKNQQQGNSFSLLLSGLDIVDGTPILDIKPYVPHYDCVGYKSPSAAVGVAGEATVSSAENNTEDAKSSVLETATPSPSTLLSENNNAQVVNSSDIVRVPHWVDSGLQKRRNVSFLPAANQFLQDLVVSEEQQSTESLSQLQFYGPHSPWKDSPEQSVEYVKQCILELLGVDVRSAWQTKKARKGKFQAERSSRLKEWKEGSGSGDGDGDNISSSNNGGGNGKHGNTSLESGSSSAGVDGEESSSIKVKRGICTQQIDNLLVEYTIEEPGSALREKGLEVDERSMGSGAEDIVLVHSISLMK